MKIGLSLNYSGGFKEAVDHVVELEKVGADIVLVASPPCRTNWCGRSRRSVRADSSPNAWRLSQRPV
jgi:hypothetical protein